MVQISDLLKEYPLPNKKDNRHEFQELGHEIQVWCGLKKFPISLFMVYNHERIKEGFARIQKTDIHSIKYLVGIIKNLQ